MQRIETELHDDRIEIFIFKNEHCYGRMNLKHQKEFGSLSEFNQYFTKTVKNHLLHTFGWNEKQVKDLKL